MQLNDYVRLNLPSDRRTSATGYGRIFALETYTDCHGTRRWVYVQWLSDEGIPLPHETKHHELELELLETTS